MRRIQNKSVAIRKISDFTCGFIGSLSGTLLCCPLGAEEVFLLPEAAADLPVDLDLAEELDAVDDFEPEDVLELPADALLFFLLADVAFAAGFLVVLGLLFVVGFLEAFLTEEDVPLCAIIISPYLAIRSDTVSQKQCLQ